MPFIGRRQEVAQIIDLLLDPTCCLLTLVGPGGIGKTRLALAAAQRLVDGSDQARHASPYKDGLFFVNLQPIGTADGLIAAICDLLALPLSHRETPQIQLQHYLRDKQLLLLLDNFEHLLDGAEVITDLLQAAPAVTVLATSRTALNLQEERLLRVDGLPCPQAATQGNVEHVQEEEDSALQLFVERARRVRPALNAQAEKAAMIQICHLVEGMPLALELAATWTKTLSCQEIAQEIQQGTDFLATNLRNIPERHRSIQAVFDHTWRLLTTQESKVFQRIAIFRGGFDRRAAEEVAGASLAILSALVDKSLLRWEADGRYQVHELLRQSAQERLDQKPEAAQAGYAQHGRYFAAFAEQSYTMLLGPQQATFVTALTRELDNIRQAWRWALTVVDDQAIRQLVDPLQQYYDLRGRCLESVAVLTAAIERLAPLATETERARTLAFLHNLRGWTYIRIGQLAEAKREFDRSQALYTTGDFVPPSRFVADPDIGLASLANVHGQYTEALATAERARQRHEAQSNHENLQVVYYVLANANFALGHYTVAQQQAQRAHALSQATGNRWFGAFVLNDLGNIARALGDYAQARDYYQQSYTTKAAFDDPEGMAVALAHLAKVAWLEADYVEAEALYQQSLALYRRIDDQGGLATVLAGLGDTAQRFGQVDTAHARLQQALEIAVAMQFWPLVLAILGSIGELFLQSRQRAQGRELLTLAFSHPAGTQETKTRAAAVLAGMNVTPTANETGAARAEDELATVAATLLATLTTAQQTRGAATTDQPPAPADQPLIEPLTEREQEVLQLLAAGLSNREIAEQLVIALGTVKSYTGNIYGKLAVRSRTQAVARAHMLNLLPS
jgi:predicted ATPase/DNA-binding CsgD family transcriptional regulator